MENKKIKIQRSVIPELVSESSTHVITKQQALKTLKKFQGLSNLIISPSSVLTGHLPPHGEVAHFNTPSTSRERVAGGRVRGKNFRAFTLIELLVVVLIVGILAAIAVPQYQVAVWRNQNTALKTNIKSIAQAQYVYYLQHGVYAANFKDLDVSLPGTAMSVKNNKVGACKTSVLGTDSARSFDNYYITLGTGTGTSSTPINMAVVAYYSSGPYKCTGFGINLSNKKLMCRESKSTSDFPGAVGSFCQKLEKGTLDTASSNASWRIYNLP